MVRAVEPNVDRCRGSSQHTGQAGATHHHIGCLVAAQQVEHRIDGPAVVAELDTRHHRFRQATQKVVEPVQEDPASGCPVSTTRPRSGHQLFESSISSPACVGNCRAANLLSAVVRHDGWMTIIKINAIRVPRESGDELAHRFAARAGAVDDADGFEGYELLKPTDDRDQWLVITRWRDEESFQPGWARSRSSRVTAPPRNVKVVPPRSRSQVTARCGPMSSPVGLISFWIGCHADPPELAELFGDDLAVRARRTRSMARRVIRCIG